jgi:hypothetical protein
MNIRTKRCIRAHLCTLAVAMTSLLLTSGPIMAQEGQQQATPRDFTHKGALGQTPSGGQPVRVLLPKEALMVCNMDLSDLRLFDDKGSEVPYAIFEERHPEKTAQRFDFAIEAYKEEQQGQRAIITIKRQPRDKAGPYNKLFFSVTQRDFQKRIKIEASDDGKDFRALTEDTIFDFSSKIDLRKTTIDLPSIGAPYLKIIIDDASLDSQNGGFAVKFGESEILFTSFWHTAIRIDAIEGQETFQTAGINVYDSTSVVTPPHALDKGRNSYFNLGRVNLPIERVTLAIDNPYYYRQAELLCGDSVTESYMHEAGSTTLYKIPGMAAPQVTFNLNGQLAPYLGVRVYNGDNPPLRIASATLEWVRRFLFFIPEPNRRYLLFAGGGQVHQARYELPALISLSDKNIWDYATVELTSFAKNPEFKSRVPTPVIQAWYKKYEQTIFVAVILIVAILMGVWVVSLLKKIKANQK